MPVIPVKFRSIGRIAFAIFLALALVVVLWAQTLQVNLDGPPGSVGFGGQVAVLPNGNIVVTDPRVPGGAAYLYSPDRVLISKVTGVHPGALSYSKLDEIKIVVLENGNYLLVNSSWNNGNAIRAGMVAWASGTTGLSGTISAANALVGTTTNDRVGRDGVIVLANGNYVVSSSAWNDGALTFAGAATWGSGARGVTGAVSHANSLVGAQGWMVGAIVYALPNGNYVVQTPNWQNPAGISAGAVTWADGSVGISGTITAENSLVGSSEGDGSFYSDVTVLPNGNYVVSFPYWDNGGLEDAGAVVWCDGTTGRTGLISTANALFGTKAGNYVGYPSVVALTNGNYVVGSSVWDQATSNDVGAATWVNGMTGLVGAVSPENSLVGSRDYQYLGDDPVYRHEGVVALANGHYVVITTRWGEGAKFDQGAVTWGNGTTGITGTVSASNSLVGSSSEDWLGLDALGASGVTPLPNGNYVVSSGHWHDASGAEAGATTWVKGNSRRVGYVTARNSLVGTFAANISALRNGNYVVSTKHAVTWADGRTGKTGVVSAANAQITFSTSDFAGYSVPLADGNYVQCNRFTANGGAQYAGSVTWASGTGEAIGEISPSNSLYGSQESDAICGGGVTALPDGRYVVSSNDWNNGDILDAEAITLGEGRLTGVISSDNSVLGTVVDGGDPSNFQGLNFSYDPARRRLAVGRGASNVVTLASLSGASAPPALSVSDAWITEGSGTTFMAFTVTLSRPITSAVTFDVGTANGTALAGSDFTAVSLTGQTIAAGSTSKTIMVPVNGDIAPEPEEYFTVALSNVNAAIVTRAQAVGTINDDEVVPASVLGIGDVTIAEGDSGTRTATFTVVLAPASASAVTFDIATADGTATAGTDYVPIDLRAQEMPAGMANKTFTVQIIGDMDVEPDENFFVNLETVSGAEVAKAKAVGTIYADDHSEAPMALDPGNKYLWMVPPAANAQREGFVRLTNPTDTPVQVQVWGIDSLGRRSAGTITVALAGFESRQFNSTDMELGNAAKGLSGSLGTGTGDWIVVVKSASDIDALAYIRTPDGFLTAVHDRVNGDGVDWFVPIFNPADNPFQVSHLRVVNTNLTPVDITVAGVDDSGANGIGDVYLTLPGLNSIDLTASDLENGNPGKGLVGRLGNGTGKWNLSVAASGRITVQSLLADPLGKLTNLSTLPDQTQWAPGEKTLWMVPPASNAQQQGFVRLMNRERRAGAVAVWGIDDAGQRSPGTVTLTLAAMESRQLNSQDLEGGNPAKGMSGSLGRGSGNWRLVVLTDLDLIPMALIRTPDGFITTMHETATGSGPVWRLPIFNPADNPNQVSVLRVVNMEASRAFVNVRGVDDQGNSGLVQFGLAAGAAIQLTSTQLENGGELLEGHFGNGTGKWHLTVTSTAGHRLQVMGLLYDFRGYLTNLTTNSRDGDDRLDP